MFSISRLEQFVWSVPFFGGVKDFGKDAVIYALDRQWKSWSCGDVGGRTWSCHLCQEYRVVAVEQYSCTSVERATPLEFGDIWQPRVTRKEDACVWEVTCQQSSSLPCAPITSDSGRGVRPSAHKELMKYAFEDVDRRVSLSWSWL